MAIAFISTVFAMISCETVLAYLIRFCASLSLDVVVTCFVGLALTSALWTLFDEVGEAITRLKSLDHRLQHIETRLNRQDHYKVHSKRRRNSPVVDDYLVDPYNVE